MADGPRPGPILVVGDLLVDVVAVPDGPLRVGTDTAATVRIGGGGSAANTACWVAHQLTPVRLLAGVGDDLLGQAARADLEAAGVELVGPVLPGATTGTCVVVVGPDGERTMLPDRGANDAVTPEHVAVTGAEAWVHVSGYSLLHEGSRAAGEAALARARRHGIPTSVDAASAGPLADMGPDRFLALVDGTDLLFANGAELDVLGGPDAALARCRALVAKRGAGGAVWTDGRTTVDRPAEPVLVVDTTGAGDALAAGFLTRTRLGAGPEEALGAGLALAAHAVAQVGARPPHPPT